MNTLPPKRIAIATCDDLPDWEVDDRPLYDYLESHARLELCSWSCGETDWSVFDGVLLRTTWDYSERINEFLSWAAEVDTRSYLMNSLRWVKWNYNKLYLKALGEAGVPIAPTWWLSYSNWESVRKVIAAQPKVPMWFLKPTIGASSINTLRFEAREIETACDLVSSKIDGVGYMLQPYLNTVETFGEISLLYIDGVLSHSVRKIPVPGDYRVQDDYGASDESFEPCPKLRRLGDKVIKTARLINPEAGPLLYARLDFLCKDSEEFVLNELEVIEPSLFFRHRPTAARELGEACIRWISK